jgi:hypothetical protein
VGAADVEKKVEDLADLPARPTIYDAIWGPIDAGRPATRPVYGRFVGDLAAVGANTFCQKAALEYAF